MKKKLLNSIFSIGIIKELKILKFLRKTENKYLCTFLLLKDSIPRKKNNNNNSKLITIAM